MVICKKHKLDKFHGSFDQTSFYHKDCESWGTFTFSWDSGRHGSGYNKIQLRADRRMNMTLKIHPRMVSR